MKKISQFKLYSCLTMDNEHNKRTHPELLAFKIKKNRNVIDNIKNLYTIIPESLLDKSASLTERIKEWKSRIFNWHAEF